MPDPIVSFQNVSKTMYLLPRDGRLLRGVIRNLWKTGRLLESKEVLHDVSFDVPPGKGFGIVGENGAGKSTLLRLAGGVMNPSRGTIRARGRIAPLIDLAAGFIREFSGWENIRLNAALLGMNGRQIRARRDVIVDFSGLENVLDQPLKIYSSGMVLRLGFAVAAFSDPDILLVDEVLAVGDHRFYAKCLAKVRDLKANGTTILLVSHDLHQMAQICDQGIWLAQGHVRSAGSMDKVANDYRTYLCRELPGPGEHSGGGRWGSGDIHITRVEISSESLRSGGPFQAKIYYRAERTLEHPTFGIAIHRSDGVHVSGPNTRTANISIPRVQAGEEGWVGYSVNELPLLPGNYLFSAAVYDEGVLTPLDHHDRLYPFSVLQGDDAEYQGLVRIPARWEWRSSLTPRDVAIPDSPARRETA